MALYFIRHGESGPIKIGTANNPAGRLRDLQTGNPEPLRLLGSMPGARAEEAALHKRFANLRIGSSEWFEPAPMLLGFIDGVLYVYPEQPSAPPDPWLSTFGLTASELEAQRGWHDAVAIDVAWTAGQSGQGFESSRQEALALLERAELVSQALADDSDYARGARMALPNDSAATICKDLRNCLARHEIEGAESRLASDEAQCIDPDPYGFNQEIH